MQRLHVLYSGQDAARPLRLETLFGGRGFGGVLCRKGLPEPEERAGVVGTALQVLAKDELRFLEFSVEEERGTVGFAGREIPPGRLVVVEQVFGLNGQQRKGRGGVLEALHARDPLQQAPPDDRENGRGGVVAPTDPGVLHTALRLLKAEQVVVGGKPEGSVRHAATEVPHRRRELVLETGAKLWVQRVGQVALRLRELGKRLPVAEVHP